MELELNAGIGGGWVVRHVHVAKANTSSIVLLDIQKKHKQEDEIHHVRLDLGKGMFLDRLPAGAKGDMAPAIAERVAAELGVTS